jgi:hypothetical protein
VRAVAAALCGLLIAGRTADAQFSIKSGGKTVDSIATRFKIDFAVPETPAFSLLQVSKGSILRPGTVREFAVQASSFVSSDGGVSIPKEFGLEFSPAMLIQGPRLTLDAYNRTPYLYRMRLSAAMKRPGATATQVALGIRTAFVDKADLRSNRQYATEATEIATAINQLFAEQNRVQPFTADREMTVEDLTPDRRARMEEQAKRLRKRVEDRDWNADLLEVAAGLLAASRDTTGSDIAVIQYAGWLTYGKGLGKWGQLLLGGRAATVRDSVSDKFTSAGTLGVRLFAGVNQYKVFLEGERKLASGDDTSMLNGGGEARFASGGWVQFSAGFQWVGHEKAKLVGNMTVKLGVLGL